MDRFAYKRGENDVSVLFISGQVLLVHTADPPCLRPLSESVPENPFIYPSEIQSVFLGFLSHSKL